MFSYPDAARYRLGVNYQQLPTNLPLSAVYSPMQRDGANNFRGNYGPDPNYVRSSLRPMKYTGANTTHDEWVGKIAAFTSEVTDEDFVQARGMWKVLGTQKGEQTRFAKNVSDHLHLAIEAVQEETVSEFFPDLSAWRIRS